MKNQKLIIIILTAFACLVMGLIDAVIQPGYLIKSIVKAAMFLVLPILYSFLDKECKLKNLFKADKRGIKVAVFLGVGIYAVILAAYFIFRGVFDFSALTSSLTSTTGVNKENFILVAVYISLANSLLEEFFFRGFSFLELKRVQGRKTAYIVSSLLFALYHIAMMIGWFALPVILLALVGLFVGGMIFDFLNEKYNNIYISWLVHMFANLSTNTIGFILFNS